LTLIIVRSRRLVMEPVAAWRIAVHAGRHIIMAYLQPAPAYARFGQSADVFSL